MADRPWGVADLLHNATTGVNLPNPPWYWCRQHEQAEHSSWLRSTPEARCVQVGPFMSEAEAERLAYQDGDDTSAYGFHEALGMKIDG